MRPTPTYLRRRLADRLLRRHQAQAAGTDPSRPQRASRAERLRRMFSAARVTPYQIRRGLLW